MTAAIRDNKILLPGIIVYMLYTTQVHAACSREDIEFYLDKGFSTDQITELCTAAPDTKRTDDIEDQKEQESSQQAADSVSVDDDELFLKTAIKAEDIGLGENTLHYTQKVCLEYGEEDLFGFTPKACPNVKYTIALKGLEVLKTGRKYGFHGPFEARVRSTIEFEIIGKIKDTKPEDRDLIIKKLDEGDQTGIPIRDDISLDRVKDVLQRLAE